MFSELSFLLRKCRARHEHPPPTLFRSPKRPRAAWCLSTHHEESGPVVALHARAHARTLSRRTSTRTCTARTLAHTSDSTCESARFPACALARALAQPLARTRTRTHPDHESLALSLSFSRRSTSLCWLFPNHWAKWNTNTHTHTLSLFLS